MIILELTTKIIIMKFFFKRETSSSSNYAHLRTINPSLKSHPVNEKYLEKVYKIRGGKKLISFFKL